MTPTRVQNLRRKIQAKTQELGIEADHDDTGHYYKFNGVRYPSVTKKLAMLKDEGLMNWKMNRALEFLQDKAIEFQMGIGDEKLKRFLQEAKLAPQQEFEGAGDVGRAVHDWREGAFNQWIKEGWVEDVPLWEVSDDRPAVKSACAAIEHCVKDNNIQPLACELFVADEKLKIGGTLDDLWVASDLPKRKHETWLIDLKTSNIGNKNSYYMQVATYWAMFKRLYKIKIDRVFILHVSKTKYGAYKLIELKHPRRYFQMAKSTYKLYDDIKELEELKKPEVVKV